jgi:hypothetical protein
MDAENELKLKESQSKRLEDDLEYKKQVNMGRMFPLEVSLYKKQVNRG